MANYNHIIRQLQRLRDEYMEELGGGSSAFFGLGEQEMPIDVTVLARIREQVSDIITQNFVPGSEWVVPELDEVLQSFETAISDYHLDPTSNPDTNFQAVQDEISEMNDELIEHYPTSDGEEEGADALSYKEQRANLIEENAAAAAEEEEDPRSVVPQDESPTKRRRTEGGALFHQPTSMYNIAKYGQLH
jgi:hypothetical protein